VSKVTRRFHILLGYTYKRSGEGGPCVRVKMQGRDGRTARMVLQMCRTKRSPLRSMEKGEDCREEEERSTRGSDYYHVAARETCASPHPKREQSDRGRLSPTADRSKAVWKGSRKAGRHPRTHSRPAGSLVLRLPTLPCLQEPYLSSFTFLFLFFIHSYFINSSPSPINRNPSPITHHV